FGGNTVNPCFTSTSGKVLNSFLHRIYEANKKKAIMRANFSFVVLFMAFMQANGEERTNIDIRVKDAAIEVEHSVVLQKEIRGDVTDGKGDPVVGVSVKVKGTNQGQTTAVDGKCTLEHVHQNATSIFSHTGFQMQEPAVNRRAVLNGTLEESL